MGDPYFGQIDAFAVYCPELDASFLVPIEDIHARQVAALRVSEPASKQRVGIRWGTPLPLVVERRQEASPVARAEDGIRTRDPNLGKIVRYRCATSA